MRVLVAGAGGQLGIDTVAAFGAAGDEVFAFDRAGLDITDRSAVLGAVTSLRPEVVVNCAAWTAVDACESDPDRALLANGTSVRWLAEASDRAGAHLLQLSTDYVFDGTLDRPYHEHDTPSPRSVYGWSKLKGEQEALVLGAHVTVVRTSWVCGVHGANMVKTILRLAVERSELSFVDDQVGHPTFSQDLGPLLRRLESDRVSCVVHSTNQGACSWFDFACAVVAAAGLDPRMVRPIATVDLQPARPAPRPANSVLDNALLRHAGIPLLRHHRDALAETVGLLLDV